MWVWLQVNKTIESDGRRQTFQCLLPQVCGPQGLCPGVRGAVHPQAGDQVHHQEQGGVQRSLQRPVQDKLQRSVLIYLKD